ncbi:MAG: hypothetical protein RI897_1088 [Verrucomicrobiota bacterium]
MPRANRLTVEGGLLHLTHRCHNRQFHLKFARDRNDYRARLRSALKELDVSLLDYCLTCNHVHLLVDANERDQVSRLVQTVSGGFARAYNRRKQRTDAVWGDHFHATYIDTGVYLQRCVRYIELNMVRCGKVQHPREWEWLGYHEIMGHRTRSRLLDLDRLCWRLGGINLPQLRNHLEEGLNRVIDERKQEREPWWTESIAVGRSEFVEGMRRYVPHRRYVQTENPSHGIYTLRETPAPYG